VQERVQEFFLIPETDYQGSGISVMGAGNLVRGPVVYTIRGV